MGTRRYACDFDYSGYQERRRAPYYRAREKHGEEQESVPLVLAVLIAAVAGLPVWVLIFWLVL